MDEGGEFYDRSRDIYLKENIINIHCNVDRSVFFKHLTEMLKLRDFIYMPYSYVYYPGQKIFTLINRIILSQVIIILCVVQLR